MEQQADMMKDFQQDSRRRDEILQQKEAEVDALRMEFNKLQAAKEAEVGAMREHLMNVQVRRSTK
jgi:hypothetical protein